MKIFNKSLEDEKYVFLAVILHVIVNIYKFLEKKFFFQKKNFLDVFFKKIEFLGFFDPWTIFVNFLRKIMYFVFFLVKNKKIHNLF